MPVVMRALAIATLFMLSLGQAVAGGQRLLLQSTTSTQNSGLYDHLLPHFTQATGIRVDVVAVGTGQAIRNAEMGDADILLVHARAAEEAFVDAGFGVERHDLMYNDFVLIGPAADPAGLSAAADIGEALTRLRDGGGIFVSRGDDSGTHKKERALWAQTHGDTAFGTWYRETGSGMGATIRVAIEMGAYTLTDRATWLSFGDRADHRILFQGDRALFNQYGVIAVNPAVHAHVNTDGAQRFIDWITGPEGQGLIADYTVDGQQLFFPNANRLN